MFIAIINKVLVFLLYMSILNTLRHIFYFIQVWVKSNTDNPSRYLLNNKSLWVFAMSIAYILMTIFNGLYIK